MGAIRLGGEKQEKGERKTEEDIVEIWLAR